MLQRLVTRVIKMQLKSRSSGQALFLVLLLIAVVLTIVLSSLSRSVTEVTVTSRREESLRAFSAAEAGVERALVTGVSEVDAPLPNESTYTTTVSGIAENNTIYNIPDEFLSGDTGVVWFVEYDPATGDISCPPLGDCFTGNGMEVCWGEPGTDAGSDVTPAIEVTVFYDDSAAKKAINQEDFVGVKVVRDTYDPHSVRTLSNFFNIANNGTCDLAGTSYQFSSGFINFDDLGVPCTGDAGCLLQTWIRILYNTSTKHKMGITVAASGGTLPAQGKKVESTGVAGSSTIELEVYQTFGELPPVFNSVIFSPPGLVQ
jgi:type II secretory pathway pseudopilin PulG